MVLLRIAIGWHILYEGVTKIQSHWPGSEKKPFSSEMYLRNSTGPFADRFRGMIPDFHGQALLNQDSVKEQWKVMGEEIAGYYQFTGEQIKAANLQIEQSTLWLEGHFAEPKVAADIKKYSELVEKWEAAQKPGTPEFEKQRARTKNAELNADRAKLTGPIKQQTADLKDKILALRTPEQVALGNVPRPWKTWSELEKADTITMYGLTLCGALMVVGLFSRLASLGAAGFLLLFYLSMPPWPGLPPAPIAEGTYLIVNKNMVELIACLMLATAPTGVWGGLDALIRGLITRPLFGIGKREVLDD